MSIRLMTLVWELVLPPGEKLVLLALADQANDEGVQCWPAVSTIAARSGQGERTVRRAISDLEKQGHLTRHYRDGTSTQYHIHPCQSGTPVKSAPLPKTTITPAKLAPKPPRTTIPKKAKASLGTRKTRLPANFEPILTEAIQEIVAVWPPGMLERELAQFKDRNTASGETYKCWQAAFRTWVRNADKWMKRNDRQPNSGQPNGLRGSRPDPSLDFYRQAGADLAAERRGAEDDRGTWTSLPALGSG